jgi:hypothetical protein
MTVMTERDESRARHDHKVRLNSGRLAVIDIGVAQGGRGAPRRTIIRRNGAPQRASRMTPIRHV